MTATPIAIVVLWLLFFTPPAFANDDTFTQIGTFKCAAPSGPTPAKFSCDHVTFPSEFGSTPSVILTGCGLF
jgi:hypothetical protein